MKMSLHCGAAAAAILLAAASVEARQTASCSRTKFSEVVLRFATEEAARRLVQHGDPEMHRRLWEPSRYGRIGREVHLTYRSTQDSREIALELGRDPVVASYGLDFAIMGDGGGVCSIPAHMYNVVATEYRNAITGSHFLSTSIGENEAIDRGAAGPGWSPTGQTFRARWVMDDCGNFWLPLHRFHSPAYGEHFFTASPEECGQLLQPGSPWLYEGEALRAALPGPQGCRPAWVPVHRVFNRFADGLLRHRWTTDDGVVASHVAMGWVREGIAMCVYQPLR